MICAGGLAVVTSAVEAGESGIGSTRRGPGIDRDSVTLWLLVPQIPPRRATGRIHVFSQP